MPNPLKISKLAWANFMSYGDYETSLDLDTLGPALIVGQKEGRKEESNGVGKTTITTAIIWCLFGRTPRKAAPGDKVINFYTKSQCYVRITTADGWIITRTRGVNGHDDLLVHKDGEDVSLSTNKNAQVLLKKLFNLDYDIFVASIFFGQRTEPFLTMSDQKRKAALERLLGLNRLNVWGDVAREYKTTAELEQQKIKALSEVRVIDIANTKEQIKLTHKQADEFEVNRATLVKSLKTDMLNVATQLKPLMSVDVAGLQAQYDAQESKRKDLNDKKLQLSQVENTSNQLNNEIDNLRTLKKQQETRLASYNVIDIEQLTQKHGLADLDEERKTDLQDKINKYTLEKRKMDQDLQQLLSAISGWNNKAGTNCPSCKQPVTSEHTDTICKPYILQGDKLTADINAINLLIADAVANFNLIKVQRPSMTIEAATRECNERKVIVANVADYSNKINSKAEQLTKLKSLAARLTSSVAQLEKEFSESNIASQLEAAKQQVTQRDQFKIKLGHLEARLKEEKVRDNPYNAMVKTFEAELDRAETDLSQHMTKVADLDNKIKSYDYIRHSYHDRNKIKMFILTGLIPYLNQRIEYYLNAFECDLTLKFTSTLSVETSRWDYDLHSGGQQKRIDLAIMFALYDLYISMYGQQCNVMVLDEVDGALDPHGVRMFVDIINNDFAGDRPDKPDTILIISHKNDMVDQFATQILVSQDADGFSHILKG